MVVIGDIDSVLRKWVATLILSLADFSLPEEKICPRVRTNAGRIDTRKIHFKQLYQNVDPINI